MRAAKRLTPLEAIKAECRNCLNKGSVSGCKSKDCPLDDGGLSSLKRIKAYCISCVPEQTIFGVKECMGQVLNPEAHTCPLHPFRLGTNPARKGIGGTGNPQALQKYRLTGRFEGQN